MLPTSIPTFILLENYLFICLFVFNGSCLFTANYKKINRYYNKINSRTTVTNNYIPVVYIST